MEINKKKFLSHAVAGPLVLLGSQSLMAQVLLDEVVEQISLAPSSVSIMEVPELNAVIYESGKITVKGSHDLNLIGGDVAYHLTVDLTDGTYTAIPYTPAEIQAMNVRNNLVRAEQHRTKTRKSSEQQQMSEEATMYISLSLSITTEDLPQWDLARSTAALAWADDGLTVRCYYANPSYFAEPESPVWTTWYVGATAAGISTPMNVAAPQTTAWTVGNYYNYDWMDDNEITTAHHEIELTFWPMDANNMVGNVEFEHEVAGEDSGALIENDVEIDYFNYY